MATALHKPPAQVSPALETAFQRVLGDQELTADDKLLLHRLKVTCRLDDDEPAWSIFFAMALILHDASEIVARIEEEGLRIAEMPEKVEAAAEAAVERVSQAAIDHYREALAVEEKSRRQSLEEHLGRVTTAKIQALIEQTREAERLRAANASVRGRMRQWAIGGTLVLSGAVITALAAQLLLH